MSPRFDSPPASPYSFSRPRPRPPRSSSQSAAIRVQNRRREYLLRNPSYFASTEHELADPLLYDSLIRRFQTPAEREAEGRAKGYARVLEGSLMRGEERLAKLAAAAAATAERDGAVPPSGDQEEEEEDLRAEGRIPPRTATRPAAAAAAAAATTTTTTTMGREVAMGDEEHTCPAVTSNFATAAAATAAAATIDVADIVAATVVAETRKEGEEQWETYLRERFVRGGDEDFEYLRVDDDDEYDVLERMEQEEAWFDEEDPDWASDGSPRDEGGGGGGGGEQDRNGGGEREEDTRREDTAG